MRVYLRLLALVTLIVCTGCATVPKMATHIDSDPPGAQIEINSDFIGVAPIDVVLPQRGKFHRLPEPVVVTAYPSKQGQYPQQIFLYPHQQAPRHLMLRMTNPPPPPIMPP